MTDVVIHLHLSKEQINKLSKSRNFQLTESQLRNALSDNPNVELIMHSKHASAIHRADKNHKGIRIQHKHIIGGKLSFKGLVKGATSVAKTIASNPVVKQSMKNLANEALTQASNAVNAGMTTGTGKKRGGKLTFKGFVKGVSNVSKQVLKNPVVKQAISDVTKEGLQQLSKAVSSGLTTGGSLLPAGEKLDGGALLTAGAGRSRGTRKRLVKNSPEALEWGRRMRELKMKKRG